ncbi:MAG TPA: hypothetical protein VLM42_02910, partial [Bryobacteraceae bacterium]|nr:hypothetical protein [Bryobacteraceae bacterium]
AMKDTVVAWSIESTTTGSIAAQTSTDTSSNTITDTRFGVATAKVPGKTRVNAVVGPAISTPDPNYHELIRPHQAVPADFTVCPVSQITIADNASPATTLPLASAGTLTLKPTVTDSRGVPVFLSKTDTSGTTPTTTAIFGLTWTSLFPIPAGVSAAAAAGTATVTATSNPGTTTIIASCTPPACNLGLGAIYSNAFVVPVSGTSSGTTVYVGSSAPAPDSNTTAPGKTLYPITTSDNKVGTAITLGDVPNSMAFNRTGTLLYMGSASGLMTVTTAVNTASTPLTTAPGKILAISPNNTFIVLSDNSKVYVVDVTTNAVQTFNIAGATAADFAPDSSRAYIVGGNQLTVYASGIFPVPQSLTGATDVNFLASGPFGYIADPAGLSVRATCNDLSSLVPYDTGTAAPIPISPAPTFVRALPDGLHLITASSPDMNLIKVTTDAKGFLSPATGCAPNVSNTIATTAALGTSFTPRQLIVSGDGTKAFVLSNSGTLLGATIDISAGTVTPVSISLQTSVSGTPQSATVQQTTGGITTDGKLLFFGGNDNQIHRIDLTATTPTDTPITLASPPTGFTVEFVAVKP